VLNAAGFPKVYLLSSGMEGWQQSGLPVAHG
jgi:3-mercaptopyruvate sulfurtransferase SseA